MINLKKVGVLALAGSLVAFAANAGELSVSGTANLTSIAAEKAACCFIVSRFTDWSGVGEVLTTAGAGIHPSIGHVPPFISKGLSPPTLSKDRPVNSFSFLFISGTAVEGWR